MPKSQQGTYSSTETVFWGAAEVAANNVPLCRFSDVLLWDAECEAQIGSLDQAETYVNMVRHPGCQSAGICVFECQLRRSHRHVLSADDTGR